MHQVRITVPGEPVAKGRHRIGLRGGRPMAYTPQKTARYEDLIRLAAHKEMAGAVPMECAVVVRVDIFLPIPASYSKKKQAAAAAGELRPTKKPDSDNFLKAALDGINKIVVRDDSIAVDVRARKFFSLHPRLEIVVQALHAINEPIPGRLL